MEIYWLEQTAIDVPLANNWLGDRELDRLSDMRILKRRTDWRLGRWAAKNAVAIVWGFGNDSASLARIEILATASGAPAVFVDDVPVTTTISLTHREGLAACALALDRIALGCDLEAIEPHSAAFIRDYFTETEQEFIRDGDSGLLATLLWSAKESALKALRVGLTADTRSVVISIDNNRSLTEAKAGVRLWHSLRVQDPCQRTLRGFWQADEKFVRTLVADPPVGEIVNMSSLLQAAVVAGSD
ncbi:MAG TPA: 4'-phosphopantetheinyl transferase superfamily protein [Terriglobales bacterium]|nr:4'-phosphopantetheinyl transferase superfamily protein [Terriglobales bacterium]